MPNSRILTAGFRRQSRGFRNGARQQCGHFSRVHGGQSWRSPWLTRCPSSWTSSSPRSARPVWHHRFEVVATRKPGFDEPISVGCCGIRRRGFGADMTFRKARAALFTSSVERRCGLAQWKIAVIGSAKVNEGTAWFPRSSPRWRWPRPYMTINSDLAKTGTGPAGEVVCKVDQKVPFEARQPSIDGLRRAALHPTNKLRKNDKKSYLR